MLRHPISTIINHHCDGEILLNKWNKKMTTNDQHAHRSKLSEREKIVFVHT